MMSLQQIRQISYEAAQAAARDRLEPFVLEEEDRESVAVGEVVSEIPFLGTYVPEGWKRHMLEDAPGVYMGDNAGAGAYFVDATGMGDPSEPALTLPAFARLYEAGYGYGIVEAGPFQVKIGVFERI